MDQESGGGSEAIRGGSLLLSTPCHAPAAGTDPVSLTLFSPPAQRELSEMRAPPCSTNSAKKMKFQGEPKKPPM